MGKQALQGSERNLFELSLAVQNAKTSLQNADYRIQQQGGLPDFAENDSALAQQIEQIRADAQEIICLAHHLDQASSQIGRGIAIQLDHLPGFDDELRLLTASEKQELQKNAPEIG